jgi:hypothetical protein
LPAWYHLARDDDVAAVDPNPKVGYNSKLLLIIRTFVPDCAEDRVNRPQYFIFLDRIAPWPQCN